MKDTGHHFLTQPEGSGVSVEDDIIRLGAVFAAIGRNLWMVILATFIGTALAYHYAYIIATPSYRAAASIVMEAEGHAFIDFDATTGQLSRETVSLNTQIGVLQGRDLMGRVVDTLALHQSPEFNPNFPGSEGAADPSSRDAAIRRLLGVVEVRNLPESLIFEISVTASDPDQSMRIANTIAEIYIAEQVERKVAETQAAANWLRTRVGELQAELLAAETLVEDFRFGSDGASTDEIVRREQLESEAEAIRTLYRYLLTRLQETVAQEGLQRPDSRILSSAMLPLNPSAPRHKLLLAVGAAFGVFVGLIAVFLKEATRKGIRSASKLSRISSLPVLAQLPRVPTRHRQPGLGGLSGPHHTEAVENLLTTLLLARVGQAPHVFVIASAHSSDGKSSAVVSMSRQFAARGYGVLVIDADIRKRTLSTAARFRAPGLTSFLNGEADLQEAVEHSSAANCDILGIPHRVANLAVIQDRAILSVLYQEARNQYDIILVDTPPLNAVSDALPFVVEADTTLLLARWNHTTQDDVESSLSTLNQIDARPCGIVMTQVQPSALRQARYAHYFKSA